MGNHATAETRNETVQLPDLIVTDDFQPSQFHISLRTVFVQRFGRGVERNVIVQLQISQRETGILFPDLFYLPASFSIVLMFAFLTI